MYQSNPSVRKAILIGATKMPAGAVKKLQSSITEMGETVHETTIA